VRRERERTSERRIHSGSESCKAQAREKARERKFQGARDVTVGTNERREKEEKKKRKKEENAGDGKRERESRRESRRGKEVNRGQERLQERQRRLEIETE
jgi:hypothetical protein